MKKIKYLLILLFSMLSTTTFGWFSPTNTPRIAYIFRVGSFDTCFDTYNYTNALDWGTNGYPIQININVIDPPEQKAFLLITKLTLQYTTGTVATLGSDWITISEKTASQDVNLNIRGAHFGLYWMPPYINNIDYLIRLVVTVEGGFNSGNTNEPNVNAYGGISWENWEVVGIKIRNNRIPSSK